jgi:hypothetical protein
MDMSPLAIVLVGVPLWEHALAVALVLGSIYRSSAPPAGSTRTGSSAAARASASRRRGGSAVMREG